VIPDFAKKVESIINLLPPIPTVMVELVRALDDRDVEMKGLARIIAKDPLMSMNLLKVANSAYYRRSFEVGTVDHAVRILGTREITMIAIACGAYQTLMPRTGVQTFDLDEFWKHSVATGVFSRRLWRMLNRSDQTVIYCVGLLHDVGKVILDRYAHDIYRIAVQATHDDNMSIIEAEKQFIGESHDVVGAWVMERWQLPPLFVHVARHHHDLGASPDEYRPAIAICSLGDRLATRKFPGSDPETHCDSGLLEMECIRSIGTDLSGLPEEEVLNFIDRWEAIDDEIAEMESLLRG
jgi:putative nucleotidyltransferase with HDIG domain